MYGYLIASICVSLLKSNNCLSVLYKRIIQVENKNVGLKVGGHKHTIAPPPPIKKVGGTCPPCPPPPPPPPPRFLRQCLFSSFCCLYNYYSSVICHMLISGFFVKIATDILCESDGFHIKFPADR